MLIKVLGKAAWVHLGITALGAGLLWAFQIQDGLHAYFLGSALGAFNLLLTLWIGIRILQKKPIALTAFVSVFKYGILLGLFLIAAFAGWDLSVWFAFGLLCYIPSFVMTAYLSRNDGIWFTLTGHN